MFKKFTVLLAVLPVLLFAGCTVEADRIYTVCKIDDGKTFVYSASGDFYQYTDSGLTEHSWVGLDTRPALKFLGTTGEYSFLNTMPGLYNSTLEGMCNYVDYLVAEDSVTYTVKYSDPTLLELFVECKSYSGRLIFNISGTVRMYFVDSSGNPMEPPYVD